MSAASEPGLFLLALRYLRALKFPYRHIAE
jgi:hypothetical protein